MSFSNKILLKSFFFEIRIRVFYLVSSFLLAFITAYQNSNSLLYIYVLSYRARQKTKDSTIFLGGKNGSSNNFKGFDFNKTSYEINTNLCTVNELGYNVQAKDLPKGCIARESRPTLHGDGQENIRFLEIEAKDLQAPSDAFFKNLQDRQECASVFAHTEQSSINNALQPSGIHFIFTDVEEAFSTIILICLIFSLITVLPIIIYHIFSFFAPSLYFYETRKWFFRVVVLVVSWCCFMYNLETFIIPNFAEFLLFFEIPGSAFSLTAETKISSYCSWISNIRISSNLVFFVCVWLFLTLISCKGTYCSTKLKERMSIGEQSSWLCLREKQFQKQNWPTIRKANIIFSILFSAWLAPPEGIQVVLALFFFLVFEILIYLFIVIKTFSRAQIVSCWKK